MIIPSFEQLEKITDSRYSLSVLVSKRARKIVDGAKPLIDTENSKPVSIAIEEAVKGAIVFGEPMSDKQYRAKMEREKTEKIEALRNERQKTQESVKREIGEDSEENAQE
ncbi:putative DNA-directed RNA polymerase [Peptoniphilus sp. ING2-D1G]|nr:putative DNA-directed RNA polymerase [Peptoniphilus sp. ING2-D1G]